MLFRMMKASRPHTTITILRDVKLNVDHGRIFGQGVHGLALWFGIHGRGPPNFSDGVDGGEPYDALIDAMAATTSKGKVVNVEEVMKRRRHRMVMDDHVVSRCHCSSDQHIRAKDHYIRRYKSQFVFKAREQD